jgi:hypothetical protein
MWPMPVSELLEDGSTRLSDDAGAFVFRRPRPGVLVVRFVGRDGGQFGETPFEEMEAEAARFGPLHIFLDTSLADGADSEVVARWTNWLRALPVWVRTIEILHGSEMTGLNVAIAAHLARRDRLKAYADPPRFVAAIRQAAPSFAGFDVPLPPPCPSVRHEHRDGRDIFRSDSASLSVRSTGPGRVLLTLSGYDRGEFGGIPFDEIRRRTDPRLGLHLLLDLRDARGAAPHVAEGWTYWFATNRHSLKGVDVLVDNRTVHAAVAFAQHVSGTHGLVRIHRDPVRFDEALARS